jgi:glycosyltransferase involved in cell wall biosynthesis
LSSIIRIFPRVIEGKGGMENHVRYLTDYQRKSGIKIKLIFNEGDIKNEDDLKIYPKKTFYDTTPQFIGVFKFYIFLIIYLKKLNLESKCLHIHGDWSSFIFSPLIKKIVRAENIYFSFHGKIHGNITHSFLLPFLVRKFCKNIFVTGYDSFVRLKDTKKAIFQPSGINHIYFDNKLIVKNENSKFKIITISLLRPQKNLITFLKIASLLPEYEFEIVGDGDQYLYLQQYAVINNIKNVTFLGMHTPPNIKNFLIKANVFLFTSLEEGTPTVVLEALACGLPIVTSNAGGISNILKDNINGYVIKHDFTNPDLYIPHIKKILTDVNLQNHIRENNIYLSKNFSWDIVSKNCAKIMNL